MRDWRITLVGSHPQLFHPPASRPDLSRIVPKCGDGWRDLLECACKRIEAALGKGERFSVREISQRRGTVRFYWSGKLRASSRAVIVDAINRAEARSHCTCEECGEAGCLYRTTTVMMTRCAVHARGHPIPSESGFENVHLVQKVIDGGTKVVVCRYDRAGDEFVEICSPTQGVQARPLVESVGSIPVESKVSRGGVWDVVGTSAQEDILIPFAPR